MKLLTDISSCETINNDQCTFPFTFDGQIYSGCTDTWNNDIPSGKFWCGTDRNSKSVGECKSNCPRIGL